MSRKEVAPMKRARLTLSQLASYDDILTDALIDHVYYWTTIRKNRAKYNLTRGFSEEHVTDILRNHLIVEHDAQSTEHQLLRLPGIKRFFERLKTKKEQEDFKRHLRKYINIWSNDCPFEISTTNRYTIVSHEAAVIARRNIEKGETVKYLCGNLVSMTPEEEMDLGLTRRDFSIVMSSRKKAPSLFLGPARFANHDCRANARLVTTGSDGMQVVALRKIEANEEITVTYGEDYFGVDNCECLCHTCELAERNGWAKLSTLQSTTPAFQHTVLEDFPRRSSRRLSSSGTSTPQRLTPDTEANRPLKRRRSESVGSGRKRSKLCVELSSDLQSDNSGRLKIPKKPEEVDHSSCTPSPEEPDRTADEEDLLGVTHLSTPKIGLESVKEGADRPIEKSTASWASDFSTSNERSSRPQQSEPTWEASVGERTRLIAPKPESAQISVEASDIESIFDQRATAKSPNSSGDTPPSLSSNSCADRNEQELSNDEQHEPTYAAPPSQDFMLPSVPDHLPKQDMKESFHINPLTRGKSPTREASPASNPSAPNSSDTPSQQGDGEPPSVELGLAAPEPSSAGLLGLIDVTLEQRRPADYTRTPVLLSAPYSRWVDCRTCSATWVQADGYTTRRECPRCERHSKLYGYQWPKTERGQLSWVAGLPTSSKKHGKRRSAKFDDENEERVLDHRTVHRFIDANQERIEHRKGRGLEAPTTEILAALAACEADDAEPSDEEGSPAIKRGRPGKNKHLKRGRTKKLAGTISKISRKGTALRRPIPNGRKLPKTGSKAQASSGRKSTGNVVGTMRRGPGRPPGSKTKAKSSAVRDTDRKRKIHDIYDYPSATEEEEPPRTKSIPKGKIQKSKKVGKATPKGWAWVKVKEPKPKPGWRGWVELGESESRPTTVEEAMAHPTATGTRRGTQLGRANNTIRRKHVLPHGSTETGNGQSTPLGDLAASNLGQPGIPDAEEIFDTDGDVDLIGVTERGQAGSPETGTGHPMTTNDAIDEPSSVGGPSKELHGT